MWLKGLILLGILGISVAGISLFFQEKASDTVKAQIGAIRNDQLTKAYYGFTSQEFQKETSLEKFKDFIKTLHPILHTNETFKSYPVAYHTSIVRTTFDSHHQQAIIDYSLLKQKNRWKIFNIKLMGASNHLSDPTINQPETPVKTFFALLQKEDIDKTLETTTTARFRKVIPKNVFVDFVKNLSILKHHDRLDVRLLSKDGNLATINVLLYKANDVFHMQFSTTIENYLWKIHSIEVLSGDGIVVKHPQKEDLVKAVKAFLKSIQHADYLTAYSQYTTDEFRKASSQEELKAFFINYPFIAINQKSRFYKIAVDHNIATVTSQFLTESKEIHYVQFLLIHDDRLWKIFHIHVLDDNANKAAELGV
ncbi:MAG: DUF4864 domain-containing protein [Parachlamydiaceae bacterium]